MAGTSTQLKNKLPYSRREVAKQFYVKPLPTEPVCNLNTCYYYLKDEFEEMGKYGYDFPYTWKFQFKKRATCSQQDRKGKEGKKTIRRKVKLRFTCKNCPQKKRWTSIVGTMEMVFMFTPSQQDTCRNYPYILSYHLRIYRMQCKQCFKYGDPSIYQSQLLTFAKSASITLADVLDEVPAPEHRDNRQKMDENIHKHEVQFCEACKLNRCFARPKNN